MIVDVCMLVTIATKGQAEGRGRNGDTQALHGDGGNLPALDAGHVAPLGAGVHGMHDGGLRR